MIKDPLTGWLLTTALVLAYFTAASYFAPV